jgi:hypothetical protein
MKRVFLLMVVSALLVTLAPQWARPTLKVAWADLRGSTQLRKTALVRFSKSPPAALISSHIWART